MIKRIAVSGIVQGVGYRPFVYALAMRMNIKGAVRNRSSYVEIFAEGDEERLVSFLHALKEEAPDQAVVMSVSERPATEEEVAEVLAEMEECSVGNPQMNFAGLRVECLQDEVAGREHRDLQDEAAGGDGQNISSPRLHGRDEAAGGDGQNVSSPRFHGFTIAQSVPEAGDIYVVPDIAICDKCRAELYDKGGRRYLHPFINCTDCGPRFSIMERFPYDRETTSMKAFQMCPECRKEYEDPGNRRHDAQPVCCNSCGPTYFLLGGQKEGAFVHSENNFTRPGILPADREESTVDQEADSADFERKAAAKEGGNLERKAAAKEGGNLERKAAAIEDVEEGTARKAAERAAIIRTREVLAWGGVAAVKGIGGFHLAVDATNEAAVQELRKRKGRPAKPFAVMMRDLATVKRFCEVSPEEEKLLTGSRKPIVILRKKMTAGNGSVAEQSGSAFLTGSATEQTDAGQGAERTAAASLAGQGAERTAAASLAGQGAERTAAASLAGQVTERTAAASLAGQATYEMNGIAEAVAPDCPTLGVMLPYAPIQLLLFDYDDEVVMPEALVMTSGNRSGAPIAKDDADAEEMLGGIADCILTNDRPIRTRCDDSIVQVLPEFGPVMLRRSRGYAPVPFLLTGADGSCNPEGAKADRTVAFALPGADESCNTEGAKADRPVAAGIHAAGGTDSSCIFAIGGELKNSFSFVKGGLLYPSAYIGDMGDARSLTALSESAKRFAELIDAEPAAVACDLHPGYRTKEYAQSLGLPVIEVQHHYAHIMACCLENGERGPVIGVAFDGTGYGTDGTIWGGEILLCDENNFTRLGHIAPFTQVGGDAAAREGWRIAVSMLSDISTSARSIAVDRLGLCSGREYDVVSAARAASLNVVTSTSAGRLFDAVAAILSVRRRSTYEGEAATQLEYAAERYSRRPGRKRDSAIRAAWQAFTEEADRKAGAARPGNAGTSGSSPERAARPAETCIVLPTGRLFSFIVDERLRGTDADELAYAFHLIFADLTAAAAIAAAEKTGIRKAALSGGTFQNGLFLSMVKRAMEAGKLTVLTHHLLPANDGGISAGQAVIAAAALRRNGD